MIKFIKRTTLNIGNCITTLLGTALFSVVILAVGLFISLFSLIDYEGDSTWTVKQAIIEAS